MQQTKFDRWLKEYFIYETHIFVLRLPEDRLPRRVSVAALDQSKAGDYKYKLIAKSNKLASRVLEQLKANHIMYATRVVEGRHFYNGFMAPEGKSFTLQWIFRFFALCCLASMAWFVYQWSQNTDLVNLLKATYQDLKGGE